MLLFPGGPVATFGEPAKLNKELSRKCNDCGGVYNIEFFRRNEICTKGYREPTCSSCKSARAHGITGAIPPKPLMAKCEICTKVFARDKLVADHKHETYWKTNSTGQKRCKGPFRAWLCYKCNTGVGYLEEDPDTMRRAIQYVEKHM